MLLLLLGCQTSRTVDTAAPVDDDGDGFAPSDGDCDDTDDARHPDADEVEGNGVDEDCDGLDRAVEALAGSDLWGPWRLARIGSDLAAGDLDGDGEADLVVGAPYEMDGGNAGAVWVLHGPLDTDRVDQGVMFTGLPEDQYSRTGWSVCVPGDMNGDGLEDMAYAVPDGRGAQFYAGVVYIVDGPADVGNEFEAPVRGVQGSNHLGRLGEAMAPAGDVDGDGLADLLIGAPRPDTQDPDGQFPGRVVLFLGPIGYGVPETEAELTLDGELPLDRAGDALVAGDFDGDGRQDIAVGGYASSANGQESGMVWIWTGPVSGAGALESASVRLLGDEAEDRAGWSVANAGDTDLDGADDLLVGAPFSSGEGERSGRAYLVRGGLAGSFALGSVATATFTSAGAGDWTGHDVAPAGDLDGDGIGDLLVSAPQPSIGADRFARVSVYSGASVGMFGPGDALRVWVSPLFADTSGYTLLPGFDLTGDGVTDLAVGAPFDDTLVGTDAGRITILTP